MPSAAVIVPTTGAPELRQAIASLLAQSHQDLRICLVVDGPQYEAATREAISGLDLGRIQFTVLPENTGRDGYYGHRIYAAFSHLVNTDYLLFLDEDNWFEPGHVASMIETIEAGGLSWCYCLRNIVDRQGCYLMHDDCVSLGRWSTWGVRLVDANAYCLRRTTAIQVANTWHQGYQADRHYFARLERDYPGFACSGLYSLNYRISLSPNPATVELFEHGNALNRQRYPQGFPWVRP